MPMPRITPQSRALRADTMPFRAIKSPSTDRSIQCPTPLPALSAPNTPLVLEIVIVTTARAPTLRAAVEDLPQKQSNLRRAAWRHRTAPDGALPAEEEKSWRSFGYDCGVSTGAALALRHDSNPDCVLLERHGWPISAPLADCGVCAVVSAVTGPSTDRREPVMRRSMTPGSRGVLVRARSMKSCR